MAQDFAKSRNSAAKAGKKKPVKAATRTAQQDNSHWSWFFSGLFGGILLCVAGYFSLNQFSGSPSLGEDLATNPANDTQDDRPDLEFYEYLPQAEVEVNVVPVEVASVSTAEEANPTTYLLQAASFLDPNDAEALRARLILMNLDARIQPTTLSGRTWYRVQAGPFVGRARTEAAENLLRQNNIDPIRMRIPGQ